MDMDNDILSLFTDACEPTVTIAKSILIIYKTRKYIRKS